MPRIQQVTDKSQVAPAYHHVFDGVMEVFGQIRGPHSILLHSPAMDEHALKLGNYFRYDSVCKSPQKELAIITGVREKDCLYVWAAQVGAGRRAGLREEAIDVVKNRGDSSTLQLEEREIVDYVRQLVRHNRIDQATYDALHQRYGAQWLIEMTAVVGYYGMLAGVVNAFEVPPPEGGDVLPV
jgi:4-carboxymuconolactone decarboxylase